MCMAGYNLERRVSFAPEVYVKEYDTTQAPRFCGEHTHMKLAARFVNSASTLLKSSLSSPKTQPKCEPYAPRVEPVGRRDVVLNTERCLDTTAHCSLARVRFDSRASRLVGTVQTRNVGHTRAHTEVFVRVTYDSWATYQDVPARFVLGCSSVVDVYAFAIPVPGYLLVGHSVEFAVCCKASHATYWDNNSAANYRAKVVEP
eukprot:comp22026_c0_seq1/m.31962 comp22026_c0_seq1/g.31962  ORF comp22026_c0_seq1/g.31962 comp22026_c0_seq1/m.31962 type:complete len:202 (-) comp22026_c0_seq1:446-1051(-)